MAPGFVSTLFSSRNGDGGPTASSTSLSAASSTGSSSSSSTTTMDKRSTLISFRKFRSSITPSSLSSSSSPYGSNEEDTQSRKAFESKEDLSYSVPPSYSYRYSVRPSTPLWSTVGSKLTKKNSKNRLCHSYSTPSSSIPRKAENDAVPEGEVLTQSTRGRESYESGIDDVHKDEHDTIPKGTVTRNSLRRTLSRLSLNAPTITGRHSRERMFTSSSFRSSSSSSPRLGTTGNPPSKPTTTEGKESPRNIPQFRLPKLQIFSPNLRLELSDDEEKEEDTFGEHEEWKNAKGSLRSSTATYDRKSSTSSQSSTPRIASSPMTRFGFSQSSSSSSSSSYSCSSSSNNQNKGNNEDTRYVELANLISIIEQSPPQARSPRFVSPPNSPSLQYKKSSFSLRRSKLRCVEASPIILQAAPLSRDKRNAKEEGKVDGIVGREFNKPVYHVPSLNVPKQLEVRSYSFPWPSFKPPLSEQARLKGSRSLNDLLSIHTGRDGSTSQKRISIVPSNGGRSFRSFSDSIDENDGGSSNRSNDSSRITEAYYPALCTPPRTPRSRHASIEWFVDFIAEEGEGIDDKGGSVEVQEIACDESTLMHDLLMVLGPPISLVPSRWEKEEKRIVDATSTAAAAGGEGGKDKRSSEAYDSLMEIIDSFPSPTIMTSSTFPFSSSSPPATSSSSSSSTSSSSSSCGGISASGNSNPSSPSDSLWSFPNNTISAGSDYTPTSSATVTPSASESTNTPASSYFCHTPAALRECVDGKEDYDEANGEAEEEETDSQGRIVYRRLARKVSGNVLASHRALSDVLEMSDGFVVKS